MNYLDKTGLAYLWGKIENLISTHTHKYAGSSSAGGSATSANKLNTNAGSATQPVYFSNGVPVKTTYTLGASVPSGAKFTDTYNIAYATCDTEAGTATKVVDVVGNDDWELTTGSIIMVKFSITNSASNVKLNVDGTGAYPIWYNNAEYTSTGTAYTGYAGRVTTYAFNGTHWVWISNSYDANTQSNTNSTDTSSKIFLVGATSQGSNKTTYSHGEVYVGTDHHVYSNGKQAVNLSDEQALSNKTYEGYSLGSACAKGVDTTVTSGSSNLPTSGAVYTAVSNVKAKASTLSLSVSGWTASGDVYTQTISASIVSATSNVIVTPSPQYVDEYAESGIVCTSQGTGTLTFQCKTPPTATLTVNIMSLAV